MRLDCRTGRADDREFCRDENPVQQDQDGDDDQRGHDGSASGGSTSAEETTSPSMASMTSRTLATDTSSPGAGALPSTRTMYDPIVSPGPFQSAPRTCAA